MRSVGYMVAVLIGLSVLAGGADAKKRGANPNNPFADANRIQGWIGTYRDDPKPAAVPVLVKAMAAQGLLQE